MSVRKYILLYYYYIKVANCMGLVSTGKFMMHQLFITQLCNLVKKKCVRWKDTMKGKIFYRQKTLNLNQIKVLFVLNEKSKKLYTQELFYFLHRTQKTFVFSNQFFI